jgi:predicted transcriptional regulator
MLEKDLVLSKMRDMGIDTFLITRMVDKKTVETYIPGQAHHYAPPVHHRRWQGYYAASYRTIYEPGYTVKNEIVVLETNLYDAKNEELIWSALSETIKEGNEERIIKNFIKLIIKNLSATNLIK